MSQHTSHLTYGFCRHPSRFPSTRGTEVPCLIAVRKVFEDFLPVLLDLPQFTRPSSICWVHFLIMRTRNSRSVFGIGAETFGTSDSIHPS